MMTEQAEVKPGMHRDFLIRRFKAKEREILQHLKRDWYLTSSGKPVKLGSSEYEFFLMKPLRNFTEMFNIEREVWNSSVLTDTWIRYR